MRHYDLYGEVVWLYSIVTGNGLSPIRHQVINWTILLTWCQVNRGIPTYTHFFFHENASQNGIYETVAILFRIQRFNSSTPNAAYMRQWIRSALLQITACRLFGDKPLSESVLCHWPLGTNFSEILIEIQNVSFTKMHLKISSTKRWPFVQGEDELKVRDECLQNISVDRALD